MFLRVVTRAMFLRIQDHRSHSALAFKSHIPVTILVLVLGDDRGQQNRYNSSSSMVVAVSKQEVASLVPGLMAWGIHRQGCVISRDVHDIMARCCTLV